MGQHHSQSVSPNSPSRTRTVRCKKIDTFIDGGDTLSKRVMEDLSSEERRSVVEESSSMVLYLPKREGLGVHGQALSERVRRLSERVLQTGLECSRRAIHKMAESSTERIRDSQGNSTADLQCVAERCAQEWKREWSGEDTIGFHKEISGIRALREVLDLFLDQFLDSLGVIVRQCFVTRAMPTQSFFSTFSSIGKEKTEDAEQAPLLHTTCRFTFRLVSAHISQWDAKCAGQWNSALESKSALRAHVARAAAIELAQSEGQKVIHFFWDMWKCMTA